VKTRIPEASAPYPSEYDLPGRKRGARVFLAEGGSWAATSGVQANFFNVFTIKLGATASQMSLFAASAELFTIVTQNFTPGITRAMGGRKRMVVATNLLSAIPWAMLCFVPAMPNGSQVWASIILTGLAMTALLATEAAWMSWMSDLVPQHRRGRYMGVRGAMTTAISVVIGITGAYGPGLFQGGRFEGDGAGGMAAGVFVALFALGTAARIISAVMFMTVEDPRPDLKVAVNPPPWKLLSLVTPRTRLGMFYIYMCVAYIGGYFAAPFFGVYLLNDLGLSVSRYITFGIASSIAAIVTMPFWGRFADRYGNWKVMAICATVLSAFPVLIMLHPSPWWIGAVYAFTGLTTSGWGFCLYNFCLENASDEERPRAVSLYRVMGSTGSLAGALLAAYLAPRVPTIFTHQIMTMFVIALVLRGAATAVMMPMFRGTTSAFSASRSRP